jgi:hypothetical protein
MLENILSKQGLDFNALEKEICGIGREFASVTIADTVLLFFPGV